MSTFYRYLRPLEYNFSRDGVVLKPRGGICFRVTDATGGTYEEPLSVSFSLCHDDDVFDRDVARSIADNRTTYQVKCHSAAASEIAVAFLEYEHPVDDEPLTLYELNDLELLRAKITAIRQGHAAAWELATMSSDAIKALLLKDRYAALSR